jgi:hypothetical protein
MAQATAKLTYVAVGNEEDLTDIITNLSPEETPMYSTFGKVKANATYHEYQTDELAAPADNAQIEGVDYSFSRPASRTRLGNYTQIFITSVTVSDTQRAVSTAGLEDEFVYQMEKKLKEHARDIEIAITTGTGNSGATGTARRLRGVLPHLATNTASGSATGLALTEALFNSALQTIWGNGGMPGHIFVNGVQKRRISDFTAGSTRNIDSSGKKLVKPIEVYESDFGVLKVVLDRWMPAEQVGILDVEHFKTATLRPTKKVDVAKVGSETRAVVETELTIESRNEKGSGRILQLGNTYS